MTVVVELTQADGHTESLTVPRALVPDLQLATALFQTERGRRYFSVGVRRWSGVVAWLQRLPWPDIEDRDLVAYMYNPTQELNPSEAIQEFFSPSLDAWIDLEIAFPGQEATITTLALMAYLLRAIRREDFTSERLTHEIGLVVFWLLSHEEFSRRLLRHEMGGVLFLLALTSQEDYRRFEVDRYAREWVSVASRSRVINRDWAKVVFGEGDRAILEKNIRSVVGARLEKAIDRLRAAPEMDVALKAISGRLNFHKVMAKRAMIDEDRRQQRHRKAESLEDPDRPPAGPSDPDPSGEALAKLAHGFADLEYLAARLANELSLSPKRRKVVRHVLLSNTKKLNQRKIAREACVHRETVKATLKKLEANRSIVRQILFS